MLIHVQYLDIYVHICAYVVLLCEGIQACTTPCETDLYLHS